MKKFMYLLILMIMPLLSAAQSTATPGVPYEVIDAAEKDYFYKGNEILSVKAYGKSVVLQKFDVKTLKQIKFKIYENMPVGFRYRMISEIADKYYFFYSVWQKDEKKTDFYCREIGFENCEFAGKEKKMVSVTGEISRVNYELALDDSYLLLMYRNDDFKRITDSKNFEVYSINVYNDKLDMVSGKDVTMPYSEKQMDNIDYSIDQEGNSYILSTVFDKESAKYEFKDKEGNPNYHIEIFKIRPNSIQPEVIPVLLKENKFLNNLWIYGTPSGEMLCSGFYNDDAMSSSADGIMLFKLAKDNKISEIKKIEIPLEVLNMNVGGTAQRKNTRKDKKGEAELDFLVLRRLIMNSDGSFLIIGEQYFRRTDQIYQGNRTLYVTTSHFNDILISKIDSVGKLVWMKKLSKKQQGDRGGIGFCYLRLNGDHFLVFQDNKKNKDIGPNEIPKEFEDGPDGYLTAFKVKDDNGEISRIPILDCQNFQGMELHQLNMGRIIKISEDEFIFEAYKKKKEDILVKVKME